MADPLANGNGSAAEVADGADVKKTDAYHDELAAQREKLGIADMAKRQTERGTSGEDEDEGEQMELIKPLEGDKPLTLGGLAPKGMPVTSEVSVMSAAVPVKGLLDANTRGQLLVSYVVNKYEFVPVRTGDKVSSYTLRQQVRPAHVLAANSQEALESVVMNALQGKTLDAEGIRKVVEDTITMVQEASA